jgi:hypothetical protein
MAPILITLRGARSFLGFKKPPGRNSSADPEGSQEVCYTLKININTIDAAGDQALECVP